MPFKVNQEVIFRGEKLTIISKEKGSKTKKPNYAGGIVFTGYKAKPCRYTLSNGIVVKGDKLKKV